MASRHLRRILIAAASQAPVLPSPLSPVRHGRGAELLLRSHLPWDALLLDHETTFHPLIRLPLASDVVTGDEGELVRTSVGRVRVTRWEGNGRRCALARILTPTELLTGEYLPSWPRFLHSRRTEVGYAERM